MVRTDGSARCRACYDHERAEQAKGRKAKPASDYTDVRGDHCEIGRIATQRVTTLADLIEVCQIDLDTWEIERWLCNKWNMGSVPRTVGESGKWQRPNTEPVVTELFQIKVWLRRKVEIIDARAEIAALIVDAKLKIPVREPLILSSLGGDCMLELALYDLHMGKLAWAPETGQEHYDSKIALVRFNTALDTLLSRVSSHGHFARILFVVGNDLLNADTTAGATTAGTPQDNDARFQKTFGIVRQMITRAIDERLRALSLDVRVLIVPGNHDKLTAWHLGDSLECYYHATPGVVVSNAPIYRKYEQFGKVMLMFTHGDMGKKQNYPLLMATEQPKMWAATRHREIHLGHFHQKRTNLDEYNGVKVRICSALCEPDVWHAEHGFTGSERASEAFIWHKEDGLISTANFIVRPTEESKK